jgi:limonene 1,2-monooxygenase
MAVAAERTRHIKLGTGVISLSYHNPLWVAERIVLLDHLTRGRVMFGAGPGSLPTDGAMIGLSQTQTRGLLEESLDIIMRLLQTEKPVSYRNDRWDLRGARLHLRPYSSRCSMWLSRPSHRRPERNWRAGMALACFQSGPR